MPTWGRASRAYPGPIGGDSRTTADEPGERENDSATSKSWPRRHTPVKNVHAQALREGPNAIYVPARLRASPVPPQISGARCTERRPFNTKRTPPGDGKRVRTWSWPSPFQRDDRPCTS